MSSCEKWQLVVEFRRGHRRRLGDMNSQVTPPSDDRLVVRSDVTWPKRGAQDDGRRCHDKTHRENYKNYSQTRKESRNKIDHSVHRNRHFAATRGSSSPYESDLDKERVVPQADSSVSAKTRIQETLLLQHNSALMES